jgi:hypothetical protein
MRYLVKIGLILFGAGLLVLPYSSKVPEKTKPVPNYDVITNDHFFANVGSVNLGDNIFVRVSAKVDLEKEIDWGSGCKACEYMAKHPELR